MRAVRTHLRGLAVIGLSVIGLGGCGDATGPPRAEIAPLTAPLREHIATGPVLRGRSTRRPADPRRAWRDRDGRIRIPPGATWSSLGPALAKTLAVFLTREDSDEHRTCCDEGGGGMVTSLPGVKGYVLLGGRITTWHAGLLVQLARKQGQTTITIHTHGPNWLTQADSRDRPTRWHSSGAVLGTLNEALAALKVALPNQYMNFAHFRIDADVPAAEVIACASATKQADVTMHLLSEGRAVWDPVDQSLQWLRAHQLPSGGWHDEQSFGYCDGERLTHVEIPDDVEPGSDVAPTALAVLALLSAGYSTRGVHEYAMTLGKGLRRLRKRQLDDGDFGGNPRDHLIATLAVLTAWRKTGNSLVRKPAKRALAYFPSAWHRTGDDPAATVFAAACIYQAHEINASRARQKRAPLADLPDDMAAAIRSDAQRLLQSGALMPRAAGTAALLLLGESLDGNTALRKARAQLRKQPLRIIDDPLTSWFLLMIRAHGERSSHPKQIEVLALPQRDDGHACYTLGSFDPTSNGEITAERIAATALGSLCLQGMQGNTFPWR